MIVRDITQCLEEIAPSAHQESYDNSGLIVGSPTMELTGVLICLDSTEEIIDEAIANNCNMVIAHHPIVFSGLKRFNGSDYIQRTIIKAIKNDIAIYSIHTNLDNATEGVNAMIGEKLGLINTRILSPKKGILKKLATYAPSMNKEKVLNALFNAGAGNIGNYDECSFSHEGEGSFKANENAEPHVGEINKRHLEKEVKIEVIVPSHLERKVVKALLKAHPYEEVAYDIYTLENKNNYVGSGLIGELPEPVESLAFLKSLKSNMQTECVRHTDVLKKNIKTVALCGGAGSFLLGTAIGQGADVFITGDFKYHQFFDADGKIVIADIGHYESEQFTKDLIYRILSEKFSNFAFLLSKVNTNPINYL